MVTGRQMGVGYRQATIALNHVGLHLIFQDIGIIHVASCRGLERLKRWCLEVYTVEGV